MYRKRVYVQHFKSTMTDIFRDLYFSIEDSKVERDNVKKLTGIPMNVYMYVIVRL